MHHVEFCVRDGEELQRKFVQQYKFALVATRFKNNLKQWVLRSRSATVVLTQCLSTDKLQHPDQYFMGWNNLRNGSNERLDSSVQSVFNVALKVKDVERCVQRLSRSGVEVLSAAKRYDDSCGSVSLAVVKSCIGNVVHTLVQDDDYGGIFLPDFSTVTVKSVDKQEDTLVTHFDHVTFACECGESGQILDWYSHHFGMRRFLINSEEDVDRGFVIDSEDVGLRLKAFEYWKCAETGLSAGTHPESIKFVIAEALPNQGPNQVDTFLYDHGGPGIQHIGLHTDDIISTVSRLKDSGVQFAEPPYTYYTEVGKYEEICDIGQDVEVLRQNGILVDAEADPGEVTGTFEDNPSPNIRYLMQKFTKPLFEKNTFFLEIIQRVGARGFGSGNITALWRSVQAYINKKEKEES